MANYELTGKRFTVRADAFQPVQLVAVDGHVTRVIAEMSADEAEALGLALRSIAECSRHVANEAISK